MGGLIFYCSCSDSEIAGVNSSGNIIAKKSGLVKVTAKVNGKTLCRTVIVK